MTEPQPQPTRRSRSAERDAKIRAELTPLGPNERPTTIKVAAGLAALMAVLNALASLRGADLSSNGSSSGHSTVWMAFVWPALLLTAAVGMWRLKYWAVLGFQAMLAIQIIVLTLAVIRVVSPVAAIAVLLAIVLMGTVFWKLVRVMARIQMPEPPSRQQSTTQQRKR